MHTNLTKIRGGPLEEIGSMVTVKRLQSTRDVNSACRKKVPTFRHASTADSLETGMSALDSLYISSKSKARKQISV